MSSAPSGSLALQRTKLGVALEIRDAIIFDFVSGLPHMHFLLTPYMQLLVISMHVPCRLYVDDHQKQPVEGIYLVCAWYGLR